MENFPKFKKFNDTHCSQHTSNFHIFNFSSFVCLYHDNYFFGEPIEVFPDPIPYTDPVGAGKDFLIKNPCLSSSLMLQKEKQNISFLTLTQTASNVWIFICCINCHQLRLLYAQKKGKASKLNTLKCALMVFSLYVEHIYKEGFCTITPQNKEGNMGKLALKTGRHHAIFWVLEVLR